MRSVDERNLSQSQNLRGIQDKNAIVPKDFLMVFRDEMMGYKKESRLVLSLSGKGRCKPSE